MDKPAMKTAMEPIMVELATNESDRTVQGTAIGILGILKILPTRICSSKRPGILPTQLRVMH